MSSEVRKAIFQAGKALWKSFPMIVGTILLISLISNIIPKSFYTSVFKENIILDSFIGSLIGSISAGTPITSYIFGGEMLSQGVSLLAVTAFLIAWVTVGIIQLPAESAILGKRFSFLRNISAFFIAIFGAILTILILGVI